MFHIILFNPEIPPNTGNIMRLCSNTGSNLHLIKPLGFDLNSKNLKRADIIVKTKSNFESNDQAYFDSVIKNAQVDNFSCEFETSISNRFRVYFKSVWGPFFA